MRHRFAGVRRALLIALFLAFVAPLCAQTPIDDIDQQVTRCKGMEDDNPQGATELAGELLEREEIDDRQRLEALGCLGWAQARLGELDGARASAERMGEVLSGSSLAPDQQMGLRRRAGGILHQAGDRLRAVEYYADALSVGVANDLKHEQIPLLINLAVLHSEFEEHGRAIERYEQTLALMEELDDFQYQAPVLFNLGLTLNGQGDHERALGYLERTEALINEHWPTARVVQVMTAISAALIELERPADALDKAEAALAAATELGRSSVYAGALLANAEALLAADRPEDALPLALEAVEIARETDDSYRLRGHLSLLARVREALGEADKALVLVKELRELDQELQKSANSDRLAEMEAILEDAKQREELMELRFDAQLQKVALDREREFTRLAAVAGGALLLGVLALLLWQRRMNRKLHFRSMTDPLTRLPNRRRLMHWLRRQPEPGRRRMLWLMDLDQFKSVNDRFGHETGDELLRRIGERLASLATTDQIVGRWGGEEFLAISDDIDPADAEAVQTFEQRLRGVVADTRAPLGEGSTVAVTTSIGYAVVGEDNAWEASIARADQQLYADKDQSAATES